MLKALINATVIDGTGNAPVNDAVVLIDDDKISAVAAAGAIPVPENAEIIDLSGKTIIPGLIDCHIHMDLHGYADTYQENLVEDKVRTIRAAKEMETTLSRGITTVRNLGSVNHIDFAIKKAINSGWVKGPRILTSGKIISMTAEGNDYFLGLYREADGIDEVRKATREQLKAGADLIKIMATGAVMNPGGVPGAPQLNPDEIRAVVEEAGKLGKKVAAHAHGSQGIKNSILAGADTIEHATMMDDECIDLMLKHNTFIVPTYVVDYCMLEAGEAGGVPAFMIEKVKAMQEQFSTMLRRAISAGVKVAMGTDAGTNYNYHGNNAMEAVLYVRHGFMQPLDAIKSSSLTAAQALGLEDTIGSIEAGKIADLVVVNASLEENLEALTDSVEMVFQAGKLV